MKRGGTTDKEKIGRYLRALFVKLHSGVAERMDITITDEKTTGFQNEITMPYIEHVSALFPDNVAGLAWEPQGEAGIIIFGNPAIIWRTILSRENPEYIPEQDRGLG